MFFILSFFLGIFFLSERKYPKKERKKEKHFPGHFSKL